MQKVTKSEFRALNIHQKLTCIRENGEYCGARQYGDHTIHLYAIYGFFVELWILVAINKVHWIEIQNNQGIIESYLRNLDVKKELGL